MAVSEPGGRRRRATWLITTLTVLASVIAIFVFLTGRNLPDLLPAPQSSPDRTTLPESDGGPAIDATTDVTFSIVPGAGLRKVGANTFEIQQRRGYPGDSASIRVKYQTTTNGVAAKGRHDCSVTITLVNYYDGHHVARSAACTGELPNSTDTVRFRVWPEVPDPEIRVSLSVGAARPVEKSLTIKIVYPDEER